MWWLDLNKISLTAMWYIAYVVYMSMPHGLPYKDGKCIPHISMNGRSMTKHHFLQLISDSLLELVPPLQNIKLSAVKISNF